MCKNWPLLLLTLPTLACAPLDFLLAKAAFVGILVVIVMAIAIGGWLYSAWINRS